MTDYENQDSDHQPQHTGALTTAPQRAGQISRQDFAGTSLAITSAATEALVASARADTEARWIMAMRNPRNLEDVRVLVMQECKRPGFAEVATYARPVGREKDPDTGEWKESFAEGLSIRFAEVAMRCAGNMQCRARVTYDDAHVRMMTVTAVDYETNATWDIDITVKKTVERRKLKQGQKSLGERANSYGDRVYIVEATDDDVRVKAAAEVSKAARTAILRLIPGHIQDEAFALCKRVSSDKQSKDPAEAKRKMIDAFAEQGIRPTAIEQWLGHSIDTGTRNEFLELSRIIAGVREREVVWHDVLEERLADRAAAKPKTSTTTASAAAAQQPQPDRTPQSSQPAEPPAQTQPTEPARQGQAGPASPGTGKAASTGKGTSALRGALAKNKPEAPVEVPPGTPPPKPGHEDRHCAGCDAIIEVPIETPTGALCYACNAAKSD